MRNTADGSRGFTLIELMTVVVIVAILASIAFPAYNQYVRKARRADAQGVLLRVQQLAEKHRSSMPHFHSDGATAGIDDSSVIDLAAFDSTYYTFSVAAASTNTYSLQAIARSGKGQDRDFESGTACSPMAVNQNNVSTPTNCWRK